jgi:hypothetical protein
MSRHVLVFNRSHQCIAGIAEAFAEQTLRCAQGERTRFFILPDP